MMGDQKVSALIISITTIDPDKMDTSGTSGKQSVTQDNETVLALFKDLVVAQDMAVPVAAMNALVLKLKVRESHLLPIVSILCNELFIFHRISGFQGKYVDASRERPPIGDK